MKKYDLILYVGRFQPFHNAHVEIVRRASKLTDNVVIIVGSAKQPRTYKNPFTSEERKQLILAATVNANVNVYVEENIDTIYNNQAWAMRVQNIVAKYRDYGNRIAIMGHKKDDSSEYLNFFPQWGFEDVELIEPLNATDVRDLYFKRDANMKFIQGVVPASTFEFLNQFRDTEAYEQIIREREHIAQYKKQYASLPYAPVFVTTDVVVLQSAHVLMIKRKQMPGKGLWALPGGFLNAETDRSVRDAAIRELKEETGIKVPVPVLIGNIKESRVFDAIGRSARGRTITHCFVIQLPDGELPKVRGMDDAEKAKWIPVAEVRSEECFEDHYEIIQHFLGA